MQSYNAAANSLRKILSNAILTMILFTLSMIFGIRASAVKFQGTAQR